MTRDDTMKLMNRLEVQIELREHGAELWHTSRLRDSHDQTVLWIPLVPLRTGGPMIGLAADGHWVIASSHNTVVRLSEAEPPVFLLPALEHSYSEIRDLITTSLQKKKLSIKMIEHFPTADVIICGLTSGMDYWADLALKWLESPSKQFGFKNERIADVLTETANAPWASQGVRQRSQKLARNFRME